MANTSNPYFSTFDTFSGTGLPPEWTNVVGTGFAIEPGGFSASGKFLEDTAPVDGNTCLLLGSSGSGIIIPAYLNGAWQFVTSTYANTAAGSQNFCFAMTADGTTSGYILRLLPAGSGNVGFQVYKIISGALTALGSGITDTGISPISAGTLLSVFIAFTSPTIQVKVWLTSGVNPSAYQLTLSDSSVATPGYCGVRTFGVPAAGGGIDNIKVTGGVNFQAGSVTAGTPTSNGVTITITEATGGTGPYTHALHLFTATQSIPYNSNLASAYPGIAIGGTSLQPTLANLPASTNFYFRDVVTDSASPPNVTWSAQGSFTTAQGLTAGAFSVVPPVGQSSYTLYSDNANNPNGTPVYTILHSAANGTNTPTNPFTFFANGQTYTVTGATPGTDQGFYEASVTDATGVSVTSNYIRVQTPAALAATTNAATNVSGTTATLNATITGGAPGNAPPFYTVVWNIGTSNPPPPSSYPGQTGNPANVSGLPTATTLYAQCVVTDLAGTVVSSLPVINFTTLNNNPLNVSPVSLVRVSATAYTASVTASGGVGTLSYQWKQSAVAGSPGTVVPGATTNTLALTGLPAGVPVYVECLVTDVEPVTVTTPQVGFSPSAVADEIVTIFFANTNNQGAGVPGLTPTFAAVTGVTPTENFFVRAVDGSPFLPLPTITESIGSGEGGGLYQFHFNTASFGQILFIVDGGTSLTRLGDEFLPGTTLQAGFTPNGPGYATVTVGGYLAGQDPVSLGSANAAPHAVPANASLNAAPNALIWALYDTLIGNAAESGNNINISAPDGSAQMVLQTDSPTKPTYRKRIA